MGIFSCRSIKYEEAILINFEDFGEIIELTGETVYFDEPLMKPVRMLIIDSILLTCNAKMDPLVHRYNLNTLKKTGEFFSFGSGPDDLMYIWNMQRADSTVWISDIGKRVCYNYLLLDICLKDTFSHINSITVDDGFREAWVLPDNRVITLGLNQEYKRFSFFSPDGKLIKHTGEYPSMNNRKITFLEKVEGFTAQFTVDYEKKRIYVFYLSTDLLEIYDLEGNLIKRIHGPEQFFPVVRENRSDGQVIVSVDFIETRFSFINPIIVNDEIFVLYSGVNYDKNTQSIADFVLVYDTDGNPLRRYKLSEKIHKIQVDSENKIIYGLSDNPEYHIIKFQINRM
jgi:hypothetical protein